VAKIEYRPAREFTIGQTVRLRPGSRPWTDFGMTGVVRGVRDADLRLSLGVHLVWVPRSKIIMVTP
jgi:hypothetical protein